MSLQSNNYGRTHSFALELCLTKQEKFHIEFNYTLFSYCEERKQFQIMDIKEYTIKEDKLSHTVSEPAHSWGGAWTEDKLDAFEKYVKAYLTIMNRYRDKNGWKLIYFDGFAGSGSRNEEVESKTELERNLFNANYIIDEEKDSYKGAAERVLKIDIRGFDFYYFIDKDKESNNKLKEKLSIYADETRALEFRANDANMELNGLSKAMHKHSNLAAMVLLDPFGMQIDWESIKQLEGTRTDIWILVPTGVIINRLLDRKAELKHIDLLKRFFGEDESFIRDYFFEKRTRNTLFGEEEIVVKVNNSIQRIADLYISKLQAIFKFVTTEALVLRNSRNIPIFHFVFASNNESAKKIASQIIGKKRIKL